MRLLCTICAMQIWFSYAKQQQTQLCNSLFYKLKQNSTKQNKKQFLAYFFTCHKKLASKSNITGYQPGMKKICILHELVNKIQLEVWGGYYEPLSEGSGSKALGIFIILSLYQYDIALWKELNQNHLFILISIKKVLV